MKSLNFHHECDVLVKFVLQDQRTVGSVMKPLTYNGGCDDVHVYGCCAPYLIMIY
jgi:hypothetical protein